MATIKLEVELRPAYLLGKRNSTTAQLGALRVTANSKAEALAQIELEAIAVLRFDPYYVGGKVTKRVYVLRCCGAQPHANGTIMYAWSADILDPSKRGEGYDDDGDRVHNIGCGGGMGFGTPTEREARKIFLAYVDSCEAAHRELSRSQSHVELNT